MNGGVDNRTEEINDEGSRELPSSSENLILQKKSKTKFKFSLSESSSSDSLTTVELLKRGNGMETSDDDPLLFLGFNGEDDNNKTSSTACEVGGHDTTATARTWFSIGINKDVSSHETFDFQAYNEKRVMTPLQERFNAITMLPAMFYGVYFVMSGCWARQNGGGQGFNNLAEKSGDWAALASDVFWDDQGFAANTG